MRIAYLSTDAGVPIGGSKGASVHMMELVEALAAEGAEVLVLAAAVTHDPRNVRSGITLEVLRGPAKGASAAERLAAEPARTALLEERLRQFDADALYERLALHSRAGSTAAHRLGIPHLVELNAPLPDESRRYRRLEEPDAAERLERATLAGAELVLAVSGWLADYAARRGAARVEVLPNAVALERYPRIQPCRAEPTAVFAGRVRPWHGIETVAAAWRLLGDAAPPLVVAGDPGYARADLERAGAELLGALPHAQIPALLSDAGIGLVPYAADAPNYFSPLKLFEYMAAGLAVVAADVPAVREIVSARTGVLVPRADPEALACAVAGLALDAAYREELGRASRELVAAEHTWRHRARRVLEAIAELSRSPGAIGQEVVRA
jgi:glycosyltransferase involved in cell wall biosynthesis